ncbi:MAG: hypothetical protein ABFD25_00260, partial [Clostridiaceae bacterium]
MKNKTLLVTCALFIMLFSSTSFASNANMPIRQSDEYQLPVINPDLLNSEENVSLLSAAENTEVQNTFSLQSEGPQNSAFINIPLDFQVTDSAFDPEKPVVYLTDKVNKKLHRVNYSTGQTTEAALTFEYEPESLTYANGELYVSLLISGHQWSGSIEKGAIAIVDPDNLSIKEQFDVNIDPFDIEADSKNIYITSGSNQSSYIKSFSRETKQEVSSTYIRHLSYSKLHPTLNRIYTIDTDSSPRDLHAYNISDGIFTDPEYAGGGYDSPYHGDYPMTVDFKISPDGKYIFNGAGTIFYCDQSKSKDMYYKHTLNTYFNDISFDLQNNIFFTAKTYGIDIYSYSIMKKIGSIDINGYVKRLNYSGDMLTAICETFSNEYFIVAISEIENALLQESVIGGIMFKGIISGIVYDSARVKAYATDKALNRLYVINLVDNKIERT